MSKRIIYLILLLSAFVSAFAYSTVITISFGLSLLLLPVYLVRKKALEIPSTDYGTDILLFVFFILLSLSGIAFSTDSKCINHYFLWTIPPILYYFSFRYLLVLNFSTEEIKNKVFLCITIVTLLSSSFAIIEFICKNFLGINIDAMVPRKAVVDMSAIALNHIRARSFMEEPGHFAFFLEIFAPLSIYWIRNNISRFFLRSFLYLILLVSLIVSFSAVGFALLLAGISIYLLFILRTSGNIVKYLIFIPIVFCLTYICFPDIFDMFITVIEHKLKSTNSSNADRQSRLIALDYLSGIHCFIGYGPGALYTLKIRSFLSLYLGILLNTGLLGIIVFFSFLLKTFFSIFTIREDSLMISILISFILAIIHFAFIDLIYYSWFWILLSIVWAIIKLQELEYDENQYNYSLLQ